eukprot:3846971-Rhodomonas_salina.1
MAGTDTEYDATKACSSRRRKNQKFQVTFGSDFWGRCRGARAEEDGAFRHRAGAAGANFGVCPNTVRTQTWQTGVRTVHIVKSANRTQLRPKIPIRCWSPTSLTVTLACFDL